MEMGLFDAFKKKGMEIGSPLKGKCVSIKEVSDPTFSEEILGKLHQQFAFLYLLPFLGNDRKSIPF